MMFLIFGDNPTDCEMSTRGIRQLREIQDAFASR
jgi:hypothetical protein